MITRVDLDHTQIRKLVYANELRDDCLRYAVEGRDHAIAHGNVLTGRYTALMYARPGTTPWASATFGSDDYKAWWLEFGTVRHPAYRVLRNAAEAVGLRLDMTARIGRGRWSGL